MRIDLEKQLKERFSDEFSLLYKNWEKKPYYVFAETAAKKKQFVRLPIDMLIFSLDISCETILDENIFDFLIIYDGCKEYEHNLISQLPSIFEKIDHIELQKRHINSLCRLINKIFWEKSRFSDGIHFANLLLRKNRQVVRAELESDLKWALRGIRRDDCKLTSIELQEIIVFAEGLKYRTPEFTEALNKAKSKYSDIHIAETIETITKIAFPRIRKDTYNFYEYSIEDLVNYYKWNNTNIGEYINDNYEKGLLRLITIIKKEEFNEEEVRIANLLLIALAAAYWDRKSTIYQNKISILYKLVSEHKTFRKALKDYAIFVHEFLGEAFFQSFAHLDKSTMEYIVEMCLSQYSRDDECYTWFLNSLTFKFINCFCDLPLFSEETCDNYFALCVYIDNTFPEFNFKNHQAYGFFNSASQGLKLLLTVPSLIAKINQGFLWSDLDKLPQCIEFDYIYPNGKNGDIMKYIFDEYGETTMKSGLLWHGRISKDYIDYFNVFYFSMPLTVVSEDPQFMDLFAHHIPTIISNRLSEASLNHASRFKSFRKYQDFTLDYQKEQTKKRTEVYSQLILQGQASPKWKSEAQLFALVAAICSDAIYQYRSEWLGMQSLDIYIPSICVGIEYQGRQHYEPIEHFGGETHFEHQKENDQKKKELCKSNGIKLVEWPYTEKITEKKVREILAPFLDKFQ